MAGEVKLVVVSTPDIASLNQGKALLAKGGWQSGPQVEDDDTWSQGDVRIWWFHDRLLQQDNLDLRWYESTGEQVSEVIFPSRHVAASGKPSLTVHPIGVMYHGVDEEVPFGGKPGRAPPPNTRLGPWFRELLAIDVQNIRDTFEISLEVTHHGPWLNAPSLFIEIGSTPNEWPHETAAELLADVIWRGLGLDGGSGIGDWDEERNRGEKVLIGLGGGHYAIRLCSVASNSGIWLGHMLANYALVMEKPDDDTWQPSSGELPSGLWRQAINEAIDSTRKAFPGGEVCAYLDRKSFKGWQRQSIMRYLQELAIPIGRTKDFLGGE
jgi:D-aminoacyl-tRNA deacylase